MRLRRILFTGTNWASRRGQMGAKTLAYDDVYNQDELRRAFGAYGAITEVRIFKQQGYAFMRFESKEAACHAICNMNNQEVCGVAVRCSWGRAADVSFCGL
jgi:hypothetical protein